MALVVGNTYYIKLLGATADEWLRTDRELYQFSQHCFSNPICCNHLYTLILHLIFPAPMTDFMEMPVHGRMIRTAQTIGPVMEWVRQEGDDCYLSGQNS